MANGNRLYSLNDIITNDTSVRHNGRVIDITTRSIVGSPNSVYGNIFVPGILAKRRVNNAAAIEQTLQSGMTTFTMSHESGSLLCPEEIAVVAKKAADAVGSAPLLTMHSLGGIHGTEAVTDHDAEVAGMLYMQSAGFGGVRPWMAPESVRLEELAWWQAISHLQVALDGLGYAARGARHLPKLAYKASTHSIADDAGELNRIMPVRGLWFNDDPLIVTEVASANMRRRGIVDKRIPGSHCANYSKAEIVGANLGEICVDMVDAQLKKAS